MKTALLYSGGLDSFCAHRLMAGHGEPHDLVYVPCGTETSRQELSRIESHMVALTEPVKILHPTIDLSELEQSDGFVPLRNLLFLAVPVMHNYDRVWIAAVRGEGSLDKSHRFFKDTSELFSYMLGKDIRVSSPVDHYTKTMLVKQVLDLGDAYPSELILTTSCYKPQVTSTGRCGICNACVRRWVAMTNNDLYEPYDIDPVLQAHWLWTNTGIGKLLEQPLGRWPDVILTNNELKRAIERVSA